MCSATLTRPAHVFTTLFPGRSKHLACVSQDASPRRGDHELVFWRLGAGPVQEAGAVLEALCESNKKCLMFCKSRQQVERVLMLAKGDHIQGYRGG